MIWKKVQMDHEEYMPDPADDDHKNVPDTNSIEDSEDDFCMEVHGDEEWVIDYEKLSENIVWSGDQNITEPAKRDHMEEEEVTIDRVIINHDETIQWDCQVVATGTESDLDNTIARKEDPSQHEQANKIDLSVDENIDTSAMGDDRGHVDEQSTSRENTVPTGVVHPGVEEVI